MVAGREKTVREVALKDASAPAELERLGIDYCCGGHLPFEAACQRAGYSPAQVEAQLRQAGEESATKRPDAVDWTQSSLADLIAHIEQAHHAFVRTEVPRLVRLIDKIVKVRGMARPEWRKVQTVFTALGEELMQHLLKEEQILFPYVRQFEEAALYQGPPPAEACFGTVRNPIRMMIHEHDEAGDALRHLRMLTHNYAIGRNDCTTLKTALTALQAFEADLHRHIHLENNILFPRAVELEQQQQTGLQQA